MKRICFRVAAPIVADTFGNVNRLDRIAAADVEQPLARAIAGDRVTHNERRPDLGVDHQRIAGGLGQIGHRLDAVGKRVMNPVQRLLGASRVKIDPLYVGTTNTTSARVTLEQQINNNITLTYITSLAQSTETVVQVEYNIDKNLSIVAVRDQNGVLGFDVHIRRRKK